jgi:hypothetical protein
MRNTSRGLLAVFGAVLLGSQVASAANIVLNPGFELDDASSGPVTTVTDWTISAVSGIEDVGVESGFSDSGQNAAYIGYGTLSQSLITTIGTTYAVSFFVGIDDANTLTDPNASFDAVIGGQDLFGGVALTPGPPTPGTFLQCPNPTAPCSVEITDTFTATSTSTLLSFTGLTSLSGNVPTGVWYLDDVSVTAPTVVVSAPEPSGAALLLLAVPVIALVRRSPV